MIGQAMIGQAMIGQAMIGQAMIGRVYQSTGIRQPPWHMLLTRQMNSMIIMTGFPVK
jgi:hypothetical protein